MTAQHTRGPWIACRHGDYGDYDGKCRVILGEGGDIRTAVVLGFDTPENEANARLIAAAPDLLEALQAAVECGMVPISSVSDGGASRHSRQVQVADMIRAAIQKATGGTHKEQQRV